MPPKFADHTLSVYRNETRSYPAIPDDEGNLVVSENQGETVRIDVDGSGSQVHCEECGFLLPEEYADHGVSNEWMEA